jgi:putative hemolysin
MFEQQLVESSASAIDSSVLSAATARTAVPRLVAGFATTEADVRAAQALRYRVFCQEMGATVQGEPGLDQDRFDPFCQHLIAKDQLSGEVIGTYRVLPPESARLLGGYYSEQEFDLRQLAALRPSMVEVGRSCVHPDYRGGAVISLLWAELTRYMLRQGHEYLVGCASIPLQPLQRTPVSSAVSSAMSSAMSSAEGAVAMIYRQLSERYLAPVEYRAFARQPMALPEVVTGAVDAGTQPGRLPLPPLIRGYLRLGAWVCSDPALDREFNSADVLILLPIARMSARYARHYVTA